MCISPIDVDGQMIACRRCYQCRRLKAKDWEGRCLAESKTVVSAHFLTLTYAPDASGNDPESAHYLSAPDVQSLFKNYRSKYGPVRYFVVGEYGSLKGRAHWHAMLFSEKKVYLEEMKERLGEVWSHGRIDVKILNHARIRYVVKYLNKDTADDNKNIKMLMSRKPPLGAEYFKRRAEEMVKQGIPLTDTLYDFSDILDREGKRVKYYLARASARMYLKAYVDEWERLRPTESFPSELVADFYENSGLYIRPDEEDAKNQLDNFRMEPSKQFGQKPVSVPKGKKYYWCQKRKMWYIDAARRRFYYQQKGDKWQNEEKMVLVT